jgi:hypothetical protein
VTPQVRDLIETAGGQTAFGRAVWGDAAFAEHKGKVAKWYYGKSGISTAEARLVAEAFEVTTDWLLGISGAPKYRTQWRTDAKLAEDLAAHVARAVAAELSVLVNDVAVDGAYVLQEATNATKARCREDSKRLGRTWPRSRESAHVKNLIADLGARARADGVAAFGERVGAGRYDFILAAARAGIERVEQLRESVEAAGWTGPVRLTGDALARLLRGPNSRANPTPDERQAGNFASPERNPRTELRREAAFKAIVGDEIRASISALSPYEKKPPTDPFISVQAGPRILGPSVARVPAKRKSSKHIRR